MKEQNVKTKCVKGFGDTVSSSELDPVMHFNVTVYFKSGGNVTTMIDLKKISKSMNMFNMFTSTHHFLFSGAEQMMLRTTGVQT